MAPDFDTAREDLRQFSTVTRYLRRYRHYLVLGGVAVVFANGLALVLPFIVKLIFDGLEAGVAAARILHYVLLMLAAAILAGFFRFMMRRTIIWMSRHIEFDLRGDLFGHLLRLSPVYYHQTRTGDVMARMTNDLEAVRQMIGPGVMYIANAVVNLAIGFSVMIYLSPKLTLMAAIPLVVLPISVNRVGNLMHRRSMKIQEHFAALTAAAQENIAGIRVVKAYRQEKGETADFAAMSKKYISLNMDLARLYGMFFPLMRLTAGLSTLMVFFFGGMEVINGNISLGTMVAFFAYLAVLMWPVIALGWVLSLYQRGVASLARINRILFTEPRIKNEAAQPSREKIRGRIELRNLHFQYDGHRVLDGIDLVIEPGQTVGIVGQTASGKTTLVSLLARLYPVDRGQIFIDDIDINDWDLETLRQQIGFATQEVFLFSDTILE
ncbi:MAG: ABC transporter transmembrane domain-containing protein, partial [candidate division Zixibacteria bacterium]|nr:ABC transporter transmembrane domain-containing protein [candidate division Zixibacteria bacterium]